MRKLKFTIKNVSTTVNKNIEKADVKITNTDGTYIVEEHVINRTLAPQETYSFNSSLEESKIDGVQKSNINIYYKDSVIAE